jgi:hypothetical protein
VRRKCKNDEFPKPISLSNHRICWDEQEVDAWLATRKQARDLSETTRTESEPVQNPLLGHNGGPPLDQPARASPAKTARPGRPT